ncbi:MAG TPA: hypothetical protein VHS96_01690 [Bacteroidia bacterium]|nr:hypothetical protein [Bacteroidia bacterium]
MKKSVFKIILLLLMPVWTAAQQLEIHHININNGDATIIAMKNANNAYTYKMIIDGGQSNYNTYLGPYINAIFGNTNFNLMVLSHYHNDHYNGLLALHRGLIQAAEVIDAGGYQLACMCGSLQPGNTGFPPFAPPATWKSNLSGYWGGHQSFSRNTVFNAFPTDIALSEPQGDMGATVWLHNLAGAGWTQQGSMGKINQITTGRNNPNNFTLGWLITYGQFRYYTAGDIGGYDNNYTGYNGAAISCGSYTNQETAISAALPYGNGGRAVSWDNTTASNSHICAFKASHHGSACSNNTALFNAMNPAVCVTSAGSNGRWKLPKPDFLYRLNNAVPLSTHLNPPNGVFNKGVFFTNLMNFPGQANLTVANGFFAGVNGLAYDFNGSYVITIPFTSPDSTSNIKEASVFNVKRIRFTPGVQVTNMGWFQCHKSPALLDDDLPPPAAWGDTLQKASDLPLNEFKKRYRNIQFR